MSATLSYNGIQITVPTNELAEALRQIAQVRPAASGALARAFMESMMPKPEPAIPLDIYTDGNAENTLTRAFLRTIDDHKRSGGAPISAIMAVLGASHAKGVGSKTAIVNRVLDGLGFAIPDVYTNERDSAGMRNWKAGPRFADAVQKLSPPVAADSEEGEKPEETDEL